MTPLSLTSHLLGWKPFVLVEVEADGEAQLQAGGTDTSDPAHLRELARHLSRGAKELRRLARLKRREAKATARAERKAAS